MPRDTKRQLDDRLEATGGDFKVMRERIRELDFLLIFMGIYQMVSPLSWTSRSLFAVTINTLSAGALVLGGRLVEAHPKKVIVGALLLWVGVQIVLASDDLSRLAGDSLVILLMFSRALFAAWKADRIRRSIAAQSPTAAR